jgi:hypothetical protein
MPPSYEAWQRNPPQWLGFLVNKPTLDQARTLASELSGLALSDIGLVPTAPAAKPTPRGNA